MRQATPSHQAGHLRAESDSRLECVEVGGCCLRAGTVEEAGGGVGVGGGFHLLTKGAELNGRAGDRYWLLALNA